jgi:FkbM family methyltransferase
MKNIKLELSNLIESSYSNIKLKDYFKNLENKDVVIYGAGYCGCFVLEALNNYGLKAEYFLDLNAKTEDNINNIPVYKPESEVLKLKEKHNTLVILCVMQDIEGQNSIIERIKALGYNNVVTCQDIYFSYSKIFDTKSSILDYEYFNKNKNKLMDCLDLFEDGLSIETYRNNISAYLLRKFDMIQPRISEAQYFPLNINFSKKYSCFVDCGAFDGDTIRELIKHKGIPEAVFAFEPDLNNFYKLSNFVSENSFENFTLLPCGVSQKTEILRFNIRNNTQSSISKNGDSMIQCIALDDVLKKVSPTFIKMDIEGAEYDALVGAKNIIQDCKPDLAICVYHCINHYFEIPLLINSWNLGYKFYLRTYDKCGSETVLYATCER